MDHGVTKNAIVPTTAIVDEKKPVGLSAAAASTAGIPKQAGAVSTQGPPGFATATAAAGRKMKPEAPVVMPTNAATVSNVGVKFGSLSLETEPEMYARIV